MKLKKEKHGYVSVEALRDGGTRVIVIESDGSFKDQTLAPGEKTVVKVSASILPQEWVSP